MSLRPDPAVALQPPVELMRPQAVATVPAPDRDTQYAPRSTGWVKIRHADTVDTTVVALLGSDTRPAALLLRVADGRIVATSPALTTAQARQVAEAAGPLGARIDGEFGAQFHVPRADVRVEVRLGTGRHGRARFIRLRVD